MVEGRQHVYNELNRRLNANRPGPPHPESRLSGTDTKQPPFWATESAKQYVKWLTGEHSEDDSMLHSIRAKMSTRRGTELSKLKRDVDIIKAIRAVPGGGYMDKEEKLYWNEEEFAISLFLVWRGKYTSKWYFSN